mmetsp:Transcript_22698/g.31746  ORF Transcript_22698/g.31746 Transcript_22698/m.31746 type:complete len:372 (-) Transcript_22698:519-1634(-)
MEGEIDGKEATRRPGGRERENDDETTVTMPLVQAQPVVRADEGFVAADENGRPIEGELPIEDSSAARATANLHNLHPSRNCCQNRACISMFWLIVACFITASFIVGFATNRPWLGGLGVLSIIPAVIILYFVYWKNHHNLVELPRVVNMFCWGVVGGIPCAFLELLLIYLFSWATGYKTQQIENESPQEPVGHVVLSALFAAFFVAALCEESLKYYLVVEFPNGTKGVQSAYSIVILSTAGALGFATLENIGYVFQESSTASIAVAIMRAVLAVPLHAATGIIIGLNVATAVMERANPVIWKILWLPILLHGTYDGLLMLSVGLKREGDLIGDLGIAAFFIPVLALSYGIHRIWNLPRDYFVGEVNRRLIN